MIQPATLPAAGNLLMALGQPGDGVTEPAVFAEFSTLLAGQLAAEPVGVTPPGLTIQPAIAAATGKHPGKPEGKSLPHTLAGAVRALPLVEDGVAAELKAMAKPDGEAAAEMPADEFALAALPNALPPKLVVVSLPHENPVAATPHTPGVTARAAPAALPAFRPAAKAATRRVGPQLPSPAQPQLRAIAPSPAVAPTAISPIPAILPAANGTSSHGGVALAPVAALMPPPPPIPLLAIAAILPASSPPVKAALPVRAAPLAVDPATGTPAISAPGEALPMPASLHLPPAQALPFLPQPLAAAPQRAMGDAPRQADDVSVEAPLVRPADAASNQTAADIASLPAPAAVSQAPAQLSPNATQIAAQAPATPQPPQDFADLIDRLVEAREAARASLAPGTVHAAVAHADFGRVSLQFQQDGGGLIVAMASGDPEFARAVQAATPAGQTSPASDNGAQQRQEAPGQQSQGSQPRGQSSARDTGEPRPLANPGQRRRGGDEPPARSGIFA